MKKVFKITGIAAFSVALFFTVSLSGESNTNSLDLASLTKISEANAECNPGPLMGGKCSFTDRCFWDSFSEDCDPGRSY